MDPRLKAFLDSLRARSVFTGAGIGFASAYIGTLGVGAKGLAASLGVDAAQVAKALKESADKLVFVDPAADITGGAVKTAGGIELFGKSDQPESDRKDVGDKSLMKLKTSSPPSRPTATATTWTQGGRSRSEGAASVAALARRAHRQDGEGARAK